MCGIFGYFCRSQISMRKVLELLEVLERHQYRNLKETKPVGGHGAGICFSNNAGKLVIYKVGKTDASPTRELSKIREVAKAESATVLGHVRRASKDFIDTIRYVEAAQPYKVNCLGLSEVVSAHNGKVENYVSIRKGLSRKHIFQSETVKLIDSEVIPHLFEENLMIYHDELEARKKTLESIEGNNTAVLLSFKEESRLVHILHKGYSRGMHVWKNPKGEIILCSREEPLQQVFGDILKDGSFKKALSIRWKEDKEAQQTYKIVNPFRM